MALDRTQIVDAEVVDFGFSDMFMSRTDGRGVIEFGNETFFRVSGYSQTDLLGAPHKIVRHPDMPKAVFKLFWDTLEAGSCIGAYVKNRAADGSFYWVFAIAVPTKDGYLSVRLKPSTDVFDKVKDVYAAVRSAERENGQSPDAGVQQMVQAVQSMGYRDYAAFSGHALATELTALAEHLGRAPDKSIAVFEEIGSYLIALDKNVKAVQSMFLTVEGSARNLSILGAKLTKGREPMKVVAGNYEILMGELLSTIHAFSAQLTSLLDTTYSARLNHCASQVYQDVLQSMREQSTTQAVYDPQELDRLSLATEAFARRSAGSCEHIQSDAGRFIELSDQLRRRLMGLSMARIICEIEAASLQEYTESISEIMRRLTDFQKSLEAALDEISETMSAMSVRLADVGL